MPQTSYSDGHTHSYNKGAKFTSADGGMMSSVHRHPIDWKRRIAKASTSDRHTHRLQ